MKTRFHALYLLLIAALLGSLVSTASRRKVENESSARQISALRCSRLLSDERAKALSMSLQADRRQVVTFEKGLSAITVRDFTGSVCWIAASHDQKSRQFHIERLENYIPTTLHEKDMTLYVPSGANGIEIWHAKTGTGLASVTPY